MHPLTERLIERAPDPLRKPVAVVARTADGAMGDRLPGLAAEIAFWVLLSLPALLLAIIATAGVVGDRFGGGDWQQEFLERAVEISRLALTQDTIDSVVRPVLQGLLDGGGLGLISGSFVAAIWTASRAIKVVLTTLTLVTGREGHREGWQERLLGFAITLGALIIGIVLLPLLIAGPNLGEQIVAWSGSGIDVLGDLWRRLYWPVVIVGATMTIALLYHLGVQGRTRWRHELPGAIVATGVWLLGSGGLRLYGTWILDRDSVYGSLAGPIVLLLWLWLTGFAVLLGAELNSHLAPAGQGRNRRGPRKTAGRPGKATREPADAAARTASSSTSDGHEV